MKQSSDKSEILSTQDARALHFIGIGGTGMSPLAEHCLARGLNVQGSDSAPNRATKKLGEKGAVIYSEHNAENLGEARVVIYSSAIKKDNSEYQAAEKKHLKLLHRSDLLAELLRGHHAITVAGTHGKTTTSALLTHMLTHMNQDPSAVVGGRMLDIDSYARMGKSKLFVAEADESDGSLVKYQPYISVLTNVDDDHLDVHGDIEGVEKLFATYLQRTDEEGMCVIGWDNLRARKVAQSVDVARLSYGTLIGCDVRLLSYKIDQGMMNLDIVVERDRVQVRLPMIGKHNAQNALCALAVARALELDVKKAAQSLESFRGVARRLSLMHEEAGLRIFDDYAHNPGKIDACISAVKEAFPQQKLHVIFQPHRYSRLQTMFPQFSAAFSHADLVYVSPVYAAGEAKDPRFTPEYIAEAIAKESRVSCLPLPHLETCAKEVRRNLPKSAIILTLGAGDVWQVANQFKEETMEGLHATQQKKEAMELPKVETPKT